MKLKRKQFFHVLFVLLIALVATILFQTGDTRGATLVVDQNGNGDHNTIQSALDAASEGDIVQVWDGIYHETLVINTSLTLTGNDSTTTIINGGGEGDVVTVNASGVTIEGFRVSGSGTGLGFAGVRLDSGENRIRKMNISGNSFGILLAGPGNNRISSTWFWNNTHGLDVDSNNNTVLDCGFEDNLYGLYLYATFGSPELTGNRLENLFVAGGNYGIYNYRTNNTILRNCQITGVGYYGLNQIFSLNTRVEESRFSRCGKALYFVGSRHFSIVNSTVWNNSIGMNFMGQLENNSLRNCRIYDNLEAGIDGKFSSGEAVDARYNHWGSDFGPYHPEDGWNGKGDNVTDKVLFDPWVGKEITVKYVDDNAAEGGDGTRERPLTSIQEAVDEVAEDGIVFALEGRYTEAVDIHKPLYFVGNGSDSTILDGGGSKMPLVITGDGVTLRDIQCSNSGGDEGQAGLVVRSNNNHISKINCSGNGGPGVLFMNAHGNTLQDSIFYQNAASGVFLSRSRENLIRRINVSQNSKAGIVVENSEQNVLSDSQVLNNQEDGVVFQDARDNTLMGSILSGNANGLVFFLGSTGNQLMDSKVTANQQSGVLVQGVLGNSVTTSFITGNRYGVRVTGLASENSVTFNYIYNNSQSGLDASDNTGSAVEAHNNWWGSNSGPYHPEKNPDATGNSVVQGVLFDPWLGKEGNSVHFANDDAPAGGNGSLERPFNSIQDAVDATEEGGTVRVMAGHYRFEFEGVMVATRMNIIGSGWEYTLLNGQRCIDHQHIIHLGASGCLVKGFNFSWSSGHHEFGGVGIYSSDNVVTENSFAYNNHGIYMNYAENNLISNNIFHGNYHQISDYNGNSNGNHYLNNTFYDWPDMNGGSQGMRVRGSFNVVSGNRFTDGVPVSVKGSNNMISGNRFFDSAALYVEGDGNDICHNSFLHRAISYPYANTAIRCETDNGRVFNNSFTRYWFALKLNDSASNTVFHNVFTGNKEAVRLEGDSPGNSIHYNQIWNNSVLGINTDPLDDGITVDARHNWWNESSGPYRPTANPGGLGDNLSDAVEFSPWYTLEEPVAGIRGPVGMAVLVGGLQNFSSTSVYYKPLTRYQWSSSLDGLLYDGTDEQISVALGTGSHVILLRTQGVDGVWSQEVRSFLNITTKPVAVIDPEHPGRELAIAGEPIHFMNQAVDDGEIVRYVWSSSLDGVLHNGSLGNPWFDNLSAGEHNITLRVQDNFGFWSLPALSNVRVTDRPVVSIGPTVPASALVNQELRFWGTASAVDPVAIYHWNSSLDGELYTGDSSFFLSSSLSQGTHILSFQVQNTYGVWSSAVNSTLVIHEKPVAVIHSITPNPAAAGEDIVFKGMGLDDGEVQRYAWRSAVWGSLYVGEEDEFTLQLPEGDDTIFLKVLDDQGVWSDETGFRLLVALRPESLPGAGASATGASPNASFLGEDVIFTVLTEDVDDYQTFRWNSSLDGELYNGGKAGITTNTLSFGEHLITLEVQSVSGLWSGASTLAWTVHEPPVASITLITPSPALTTEEIVFQGEGADDGEITCYVWESSLAGELYNGSESSFSVTGLQPGEHILYFKAQDNFGVWSDWATHTLTVAEPAMNRAPTAGIGSPEPGKPVSGSLLFEAEAMDQDGSVVRYVWRSSLDGELYNGSEASFTHQGLTLGEHTITLRTQDNEGAWSQETTLDVVVESEDQEDSSSSGLWLLGGIFALCLAGLLIFPTPLQDYLKAWLEERGLLERFPFK